MGKDDAIFQEYGRTGRWQFKINGSTCTNRYETQVEAAKGYVKAFISLNPKYKTLVTGKKWPEVFRIIGVNVK